MRRGRRKKIYLKKKSSKFGLKVPCTRSGRLEKTLEKLVNMVMKNGDVNKIIIVKKNRCLGFSFFPYVEGMRRFYRRYFVLKSSPKVFTSICSK